MDYKKKKIKKILKKIYGGNKKTTTQKKIKKKHKITFYVFGFNNCWYYNNILYELGQHKNINVKNYGMNRDSYFNWLKQKNIKKHTSSPAIWVKKTKHSKLKFIGGHDKTLEYIEKL